MMLKQFDTPAKKKKWPSCITKVILLLRLVAEFRHHRVLCLPGIGKIEDFFMQEMQRFVMLLLIALVLSSCGRAGVSYHQTLAATYTLYPQLALPADLTVCLLRLMKLSALMSHR